MSSTRTLKVPSSRRYRHVVSLEAKEGDDWGGGVDWQPVRPMFADIRPRTGSTQTDQQQEVEVTKYDIFTAWHPDGFPEGELRLLEGERKFYVDSTLDVGEDHREHKLVCTLRTDDG